MAFCPGCGTQVADGTTFCPSCGKPMSASTGGGAAAAPAPAVVAAAPSSGLADNVAGLLCYCPFLVGIIASVIFLVTDPYKTNKFLRFHAFQSLFMHAAFFVMGIAFMVLNMVLGAIFFPLVAVAGLLELLIWLGALVLIVMMMVKAYNLQTTHLPIVGALADKQV
jgi:uncharacterized membrane protein